MNDEREEERGRGEEGREREGEGLNDWTRDSKNERMHELKER